MYNFNPVKPALSDIAMYTQYMANSYTAISSVKNYLSGSKFWVLQCGGDISSFLAFEPSEVLKGVAITSKHTPLQAPPLTASYVRLICMFLDNSPNAIRAIKPCILISYSCMFRASNVVAPNLTSWAGAHTLLTRDVLLSEKGLRIIVRSTKTLARRSPVLLEVLANDDPCVCPARAWLLYKSCINPQISGPAFVKADGTPLTARPVVAAIRAALIAAGAQNVARISMHSLRRGAAQEAYLNGASKQEIMNQGVWKSESGLNAYIKPVSTVVPQILSDKLAYNDAENI